MKAIFVPSGENAGRKFCLSADPFAGRRGGRASRKFCRRISG
jgi:hypothetical protein